MNATIRELTPYPLFAFDTAYRLFSCHFDRRAYEKCHFCPFQIGLLGLLSPILSLLGARLAIPKKLALKFLAIDGAIECFSAEHFIREIFLDSDTDMAVLSVVPAAPEDNPLSTEEAAVTRIMVESIQGHHQKGLQATS